MFCLLCDRQPIDSSLEQGQGFVESAEPPYPIPLEYRPRATGPRDKKNMYCTEGRTLATRTLNFSGRLQKSVISSPVAWHPSYALSFLVVKVKM